MRRRWTRSPSPLRRWARVRDGRWLSSPPSTSSSRPPRPFFRPWRALFSSPQSFSLPCSVYRRMRIVVALLDESCAFHEGAEVVERDTSVYLQECSFDDVLKLGSVERAGACQCQQMPPSLRSEPPAFMRA